MQIKTISYQRVLNLGNYESKRLELYAEVLEGEDPDVATTKLIEKVESKIREEVESGIVERIEKLKTQEWELQAQVKELKTQFQELRRANAQLTQTQQTSNPTEIATPDGVPF
ncbi:MAG: hypothetical protein RMY29_014495 [Nostoc sp. CreGUA01]